jgi:hypothetical protein
MGHAGPCFLKLRQSVKMKAPLPALVSPARRLAALARNRRNLARQSRTPLDDGRLSTAARCTPSRGRRVTPTGVICRRPRPRHKPLVGGAFSSSNPGASRNSLSSSYWPSQSWHRPSRSQHQRMRRAIRQDFSNIPHLLTLTIRPSQPGDRLQKANSCPHRHIRPTM